MIGNNPSLFRGEGFDFSELREYQLGDDVRKIDWTISAKLQKPYVKLFHEERQLNIVCACVMGGSLYFGTRRIKQEVVVETAAVIGYSAVKNQDRFIGVSIQDGHVEVERPAKRLTAVNGFVQKIDQARVVGVKSDYVAGMRQLYGRLKRRSLVFVIGDFLAPADLGLLARRHEVIAVIIRDRFEERPEPLGRVHLVDPESGETLQTQFGKEASARYRAERIALDRALFAHLHKHRIRFVKIYTDEDPFGRLIRLFGGRI